MSATHTAHVQGRSVVVRTTVPDSPESRALARKLACGEAHTATIGKLTRVDETGTGVTYTWGPVTPRGTRKPAPAPVRETASGPASGQVADLIANLAQLTPDVRAAIVAALTGDSPAPAPAPRELPEFIKRAQAVTCRTCRDHGVVRGVGANAGKPYRTADGAAAAKAAGRAVKCPSHKRASKSA
jgi:hypothetical protein